jgi:hypothetical protein
LLAIADAAGGEWPDEARGILKAIAATSDDEDMQSLAELLLGDIRDIFDELGETVAPNQRAESRISFAALIERLVKLPLRPWGAYGKAAKPITQHQLAARLRPFRLTSRQWHGDGEDTDRVRGYIRKDLENAFDRYLPPKSQRDSGTEPDLLEQLGDSDSVTPKTRHAVKNAQKPNNDGPDHAVTLWNREIATRAELSSLYAPMTRLPIGLPRSPPVMSVTPSLPPSSTKRCASTCSINTTCAPKIWTPKPPASWRERSHRSNEKDDEQANNRRSLRAIPRPMSRRWH